MDDLEKLETEFLKTPVLKAEYDAIEPEYELIRQLIKARAENKKMTQKQLPEKNRYQVVKYCPSGKKKFLTFLLVTETANLNEGLITFQELTLFLVRYAFILTDTESKNIFLKRVFSSLGEPSTQNSNGARYLDPKYSRWISTDPALGEYMSGSDAGCGGAYNPVNMSLYHYAGNNPVRYVDPDGNQSSIYLPGGGTNYNGPCPGMKYNMTEYSKECQIIADAAEMAFSETNAIGIDIFIDKITGGKKRELAIKYQVKVNIEFLRIQMDFKLSGEFDLDKDGKYNATEVKYFADSVNTTMLLNYSDKKSLGPYAKLVHLPLLTDFEAEKYLNSITIDYSDKKKDYLIRDLERRINQE